MDKATWSIEIECEPGLLPFLKREVGAAFVRAREQYEKEKSPYDHRKGLKRPCGCPEKAEKP